MNGEDSLVIELPDAQRTFQLGVYLGQQLAAGTVLLLNGDLGAGKTTLVQGLGRGLGINDAIVSPTFTLINEYREGRIPLYHFDLYRLETQEISALNIELFGDGVEYPLGIIAIEWAELLPELPPQFLSIELQNLDEGRTARFQNQGSSVDLRSLNSYFLAH
jgi:tRNA threonylcarbamoyladenosine biosynthesis protein TsaE